MNNRRERLNLSLGITKIRADGADDDDKAIMNIYEVVYTAEREQDQADVIYLVRAPDFRSAIDIAGHSLSRKHHNLQVPQVPWVVYELGADSSGSHEALLLRGPYVQSAFNYGWKRWEPKLKGGVPTDEWEEKSYGDNSKSFGGK